MANLNDYIGSSMLELMLARAPAEDLKGDLDLLKMQITDIQKSVDRWLEEKRQCNLAPARDEHRWDIVQRNFDFEQERLQKAIKERENVQRHLTERHFDLVNKAMSTLSEALRLLPPVIMNVRNELDVSTDESGYLQVLEQSRVVMQKRMAEFMEQIKDFDRNK